MASARAASAAALLASVSTGLPRTTSRNAASTPPKDSHCRVYSLSAASTAERCARSAAAAAATPSLSATVVVVCLYSADSFGSSSSSDEDDGAKESPK